MYKISLLFLSISSPIFSASTLLIRTGLQRAALRAVLSVGVTQQRLQSNKNSADHVPKLDAFTIFSPIAPMLWSAFYDDWGHPHRIPLSRDSKVALLKSVISLANVDNRDQHEQVRDSTAWKYRCFLDKCDPQYADNFDWTGGKFFDLALSTHLVMTCRNNEPHSKNAKKARKRIVRIMKKYDI